MACLGGIPLYVYLLAATYTRQAASFVAPLPRRCKSISSTTCNAPTRRRHPKSHSCMDIRQSTLTCTAISSSTFSTSTEYSHWHVFKSADQLEQNGLTSALPVDERTQALTRQTISILREWGAEWAGQQAWQGLLNKSSLLHEIEESIVALCPLLEWLDDRKEENEPIILVDVCCGKGIFAMLASYMFQDDPRVERIVMLDKAEIKWNHILAANDSALNDGRPMITMWDNCNLHGDGIVDRLDSLKAPLALVGLHLCKTLSPTFVGITNTLGPLKCPYLCLAPCCLPRMVTQPKDETGGKAQIINVLENEAGEERKLRLEANTRRKDAMKRLSDFQCYLCQSSAHKVHECSLLPADVEERIDIFRKSSEAAPCFRCGQVGHFKADCPSDQKAGKPSLVLPPHISLDVSGVMESESPFGTYCSLLSTAVQRGNVRLRDTNLVSNPARHQTENWNSDRKSVFIIGTEEAR
jgi:hypothetical protein